jgi:hypothetical protein
MAAVLQSLQSQSQFHLVRLLTVWTSQNQKQDLTLSSVGLSQMVEALLRRKPLQVHL